MADDRDPSQHFSCPIHSQFGDQTTEDRLLLRWDADIRRAAAAAARRANLGQARVDDVSQDARLRVLRLVRRGGPSGEAYVRKVIANSVRTAARREARALSNLPAIDDEATGCQAGSTGTSSPKPDPTTMEVAMWVRGLPARLQAIYQLIYAKEYTQREVGAAIGVTQPRVTQLHRELLRRGCVELAHLAA